MLLARVRLAGSFGEEDSFGAAAVLAADFAGLVTSSSAFNLGSTSLGGGDGAGVVGVGLGRSGRAATTSGADDTGAASGLVWGMKGGLRRMAS